MKLPKLTRLSMLLKETSNALRILRGPINKKTVFNAVVERKVGGVQSNPFTKLYKAVKVKIWLNLVVVLLLAMLFGCANLYGQDSTNSVKFNGVDLKWNSTFQTTSIEQYGVTVGLRTGFRLGKTNFSVSLDNDLKSNMRYFYKNFYLIFEISYKLIR